MYNVNIENNEDKKWCITFWEGEQIVYGVCTPNTTIIEEFRMLEEEESMEYRTELPDNTYFGIGKYEIQQEEDLEYFIISVSHSFKTISIENVPHIASEAVREWADEQGVVDIAPFIKLIEQVAG